jgi:hypothetical protein
MSDFWLVRHHVVRKMEPCVRTDTAQHDPTDVSSASFSAEKVVDPGHYLECMHQVGRLPQVVPMVAAAIVDCVSLLLLGHALG